jgi:hypothetical protein
VGEAGSPWRLGPCPHPRIGGAVVSDGDRPNILVIWGDDIGITNPSL